MSLAANVSNLATRLGTEFKSVYAKIGNLTSLTTTNKTDLVSALNEVKAAVGTAGAAINDVTASGVTTYSANKINTLDAATLTSAQSYADTKVANLVASAPATLDTLNELATALGNDANYATTTSTALGNRLRFDAAQTLTAPQLTQGQTNLGVPSTTQVGDTTTDFVATFNAALL